MSESPSPSSPSHHHRNGNGADEVEKQQQQQQQQQQPQPQQQQVMCDRRYGVGPRLTVPEFLMQLYARVAQNDASCREVRLCHKGLTGGGGSRQQQTSSNHNNNNYNNYQALLIHMAKLLEENTHVELFFLHQTEVGTKAALAIGTMLRLNQGITTLSFHRMDATYLATVLGTCLPENRHVTSLTLFANTFASFPAFEPLTIALEYDRTRSLTQLSLEGCHLNDPCLASLWHALSTNSVLTKLDFRDMRLTEGDVIALCRALSQPQQQQQQQQQQPTNHNATTSQVRSLLLDKNWMQDQGCAAVFRWVASRAQSAMSTTTTTSTTTTSSSSSSSSSTVIQELSLAYNHIGSAGMLALADTLMEIRQTIMTGNNSSSLRRDNNHGSSIRNVKEIISTLNLSGNAFTTEDIVSLVDAMTASPPSELLLPPPPPSSSSSSSRTMARRSMMMEASSSSSSSVSLVSKLSMEDCSLHDDAMLYLAQHLPQLRHLVGLNISGHVVSTATAQVFVQVLQSTSPCVSSLHDLQLDLQYHEDGNEHDDDDDEDHVVVVDQLKAQLDFYLRLNRAGRYLLSLSHYVDDEQDATERLSSTTALQQLPQQQRQDEGGSDHPALAFQSRPKSMPCSLWPLVLARLSRAEITDDATVNCVGGTSHDSRQPMHHHHRRHHHQLPPPSNHGTNNRPNAGIQVDVMYYMIRENAELIQLPWQVIAVKPGVNVSEDGQGDDGADETNGEHIDKSKHPTISAYSSTRKRKRSVL